MAGRAQISGTELQRLLDLVRDADSVELKLTLPEKCPSRDRRRLGRRSTRRADAAGLLLRHPRPRTQPRRSRRSGPASAGRGGRYGHQAPPGRARRASRRAPSFQDLQRRGGRDAWRVRVLRVVQRLGGQRRDPGGCRRHALDPQALLEGAASVLFRPRTRRTRARPALRARADPDAQAEDQAEGIRAPARRGVVAVSGRLPDRRAVHEGSTIGRVPGRCRGESLPHRHRRRSRGGSSRRRRRRHSSSSRGPRKTDQGHGPEGWTATPAAVFVPTGG